MGSLLKGLIPSKFIIILIVALGTFCGYLYLTKQTLKANMATIQTELTQANEKIETQKQAIELLEKDAKVQKDLMEQYKLTVTDIRNQTLLDLAEIANTDFGKEANSNAPALEKVINERTQLLLDNIQRISKGK